MSIAAVLALVVVIALVSRESARERDGHRAAQDVKPFIGACIRGLYGFF